MKTEGVDSIVMEVSSQFTEFKRVAGCQFEVGVFTNLTLIILTFIKVLMITVKPRQNSLSKAGRQLSI